MKNVFFSLMLFSSVVNAQPFRGNPTPNDTYTLYVFCPNNAVALSIYAPKASDVSVSGDFPGGFPPAKLARAIMVYGQYS
jgi:enterochelin esterase family protein